MRIHAKINYKRANRRICSNTQIFRILICRLKILENFSKAIDFNAFLWYSINVLEKIELIGLCFRIGKMLSVFRFFRETEFFIYRMEAIWLSRHNL